MAVTEVQTESYFSRLGNSFKGIGGGLLLFLIAFPLLFWNEGRAVKRAKALETGAGAVVSVQADKVDPANEGKLVHVTAKADTKDVLTDPLFKISSTAIRLERRVEMYQWKQNESSKTEKQLGGGTKKTTVYTYEKVWSDKPVNSAYFKEAGHENPGFPFESEKLRANHVTLGDFLLNDSLVDRLGDSRKLPVPADYKLPAALSGKSDAAYVHVSRKSSAPSQVSQEQPADNAGDAALTEPAIGDLRISWYAVVPHEVSIVARQTGKTFSAYPVGSESILLIADSVQSAEAMFQSAQSANSAMTWFLRIAGLVMMYVGLSCVLRPLSVLMDVIPFLGDLIGAGISLISFLIALPCTLVTIAVAWIYYRPLLGIGLLVVAAALIVFLFRKKAESHKRRIAADAAA
ncbi:MAG: TMEM43 family protein [Victivallales bacterium]|mgnify:FL=1|nr:TMEM43 family protein [Victivallales bacterium]